MPWRINYRCSEKEVMLAISELEQRKRAYFYGNIMLFDHKQQKLDSSILIRTVIKGSSDMNLVGKWIVITRRKRVLRASQDESRLK